MNNANRLAESCVFIFAHGAGAGMDSEFMLSVSNELEKQGVEVVRFEFPYMKKFRELGKRRPPDRMPKLIDAFEEKIDEVARNGVKNIIIGGKSMGGRVASLVAAKPEHSEIIKGVVCLGFPFHPPKKPEKYRGEHLSSIQIPTLILQGERDPFGTKKEVDDYLNKQALISERVTVQYLKDGDHSFKPRVLSGETFNGNILESVNLVYGFCQSIAVQ